MVQRHAMPPPLRPCHPQSVMFTSPLLDHPAIVRGQRERAGVEAVAARDECTMCHARADGRWTFHIYRRDRATHAPAVDVPWCVPSTIR